MSQTGKKNLVITSIALYFTYFIHGIGASIMGQYKPELAARWGAKALSDGTMDVSMVVSVIAALGLGRLISLPFSGPVPQIRTQIKWNHWCDLLCSILYGNRICTVYGRCLCICHCGWYRKLFPGYLCKSYMHGDLCQQSFYGESVYKILHVYQSVPAYRSSSEW